MDVDFQFSSGIIVVKGPSSYHKRALVYLAGRVYAQTSKIEPNDAERAMTLLRRAAKEGFHNTVLFATDTDLDPVRDRADFQKLAQAVKDLVQ